ncbi:MAG: ABC transporter substrate-binding protein [Chloroflexi bacterium]|nr:ABC transporter substrate-binding protein [Chloroflexota bacterium]
MSNGNPSTNGNYWLRLQGRHFSRRRVLAGAGVAAAGAAGLALAGCGDDDDNKGNGASSSGATGGNVPTKLSDLKKMTLNDMRTTFTGARFKNLDGYKAGPQAGGTLRYWFVSLPDWDPTGANGGLMASYMFAHNQLLQIKVNDSLKNPNFMEFEPGLATAMPEQPDNLTYIFKLQQGVKFQNLPPVNGRELTAQDIVYASEAYRKAPAQGPTYEQVDKIEATDKYTVKFTTSRPAAYFLSALGTPFHWIFSREQKESADGLAKKPIGTGAFMLDSVQDNGGYKVVKNPTYFRKDPVTGKQLPYLDAIETTYITDPAQTLAAYRAKQLDHYYPDSRERWEQVMETDPDSVTQVTTPPPSFQPYIVMRLDTPPLNDVRVRQALSLMIDRDSIIKNIHQGMAGYGYGQDWTFFGREWPWESNELGKWNKFDPKAAKDLLSAAGVKDLNLDFFMQAFAGANFDVWSAAAGMLNAQGVKTNIDAPQDVATIVSTFYGGKFKGLAGTGLLGPGMDPDTFTYKALHSKSLTNYTFAKDPKLDELGVKQRETFDINERKKIVQEFMDYDLDQATRIWLVTPYKINVRRPNFFNLIDTEAAWNPLGWGSVGLDMAYRRTT